MSSETYYQYSRPEMLAYVPDTCKKVLEIGCGEGGFAKLIKEKLNPELWGVELSSEAALQAENILDHVINEDINKALDKLPNNYFDCVICNDVLEHMANPESILQHIRNNILVSKGFIISSIPNVRYIHNLYELLIKKDWRYRDEGILDSTHLRFFTKKSIKRMFDKTGFDVLICEGIQPVTSKKFELFNYLTLLYFSDTRYLQFATVAQKKDDNN